MAMTTTSDDQKLLNYAALKELAKQIKDADTAVANAAAQALTDKVGTLVVKSGDAANVANAIAKEKADREAAIGTLTVADQAAVTVENAIALEATNRVTAVSAEQERAEGVEAVLQEAIDLLNNEATVAGSVKYAVKAEEDARKAQIGELGKVSAEEGAADHTVKSFVEAKISDVNNSADELAALVGAAKLAEGQSTVLARLGVIEGVGEGSVAKALADAEAYADDLDEAMDARVVALEATHATKTVGENTVFQTVQEEVNTAITALVNGAPEALDTLSELASWVANLGAVEGKDGQVTDVASLVARVDANTATIDLTNLKVAEGAQVTIPNAIAKAVADASSANSDLAKLVGELPEDATATTVVAYAKELADTEAARIDGIVGTPDAGKTIQAEIDDAEARIKTLEDSDHVNVINKITVNGVEATPDENKVVEITDVASAEALADLEDLVGSASDNKDAATVFGAIAAEADARATAISNEAARVDGIIGEIPESVTVGEAAVETATVVAYVDAKISGVTANAAALEARVAANEAALQNIVSVEDVKNLFK